MLSFFKTVSLSFLLLSLGLNVVFAQKQQPDSTKHQDLGEVVVDGFSIKRQRATMPIQQFDAKEIKLLNASNVADVAKHLAGVTVKDYGGIGGVKTVSVRGFGAAHTGVCFDGLMVNDIQTGQIDLGKFSVENIAEISLSNGQPNDFFQPARMFASASVLSFSSLQFKNDSTNPFHAKGTFKTGSFGLINPSLLLSKGFAKRWSATIMADGATADGVYKFEPDINPNGPANIINRTRTNGDVHSLKSEALVFGNLHEFETLSIKTNFNYSERGLPGSIIIDNTYSKDRILDKSFLAQVIYKNKQSCLFQYQAQCSANKSQMRYSSGTGIMSEYLQGEYYATATAQYYPFSKLALTTAVDWIYNDLTSTYQFKEYNSSANRNTILANVAAKYFTSRLTVGANLLYTTTQESATEKAAQNRNKFTPTVSFSYKVLEDSELRLRGFYKNIFRMPTFAELYYHDFGYTELRPEIANQYNLGVVYYSNHALFMSDLELTVDGYYESVTDKITIRYGIPNSSVRNVGSVIVNGLDVGFKSRIPITKVSGFNLHLNYSRQIALDRTEGSPNYGEQIPYTPFNSGAGSVGYQYKILEAGYNLIYSGSRWDGPNVKYNKLKAYTEHSLYAKCTYKKATVMAEVINFMDTNYDIIKWYPMPGRNYRLTLSYNF